MLNTDDGGIPISNGTDAMPSEADIDVLMNGGTPNQSRVQMGEDAPGEEADLGDDGTVTKDAPAEEVEAEETAPPVDLTQDPIVQKYQGELSKLSPTQRQALGMGPQTVELNYKGEAVKIAPDKQVALMQQGLDYSVKMRGVNTRAAEVEARAVETEAKGKHFAAIEKVAKDNPDWWAHVQANYQKFQGSKTSGNAQHGAPDDAEMTPALRDALSKIDTLEGKLNGFLEKGTQEAALKQTQTEDAELDQHITSFRKEHPDLDWMTADKNGLVLEDRIVDHAHKNGINNFRAAARDFLHDELVSRREQRAKETLSDSIRSKKKTGIVKTTQTKGLKPPSNLNRSYDDLVREGLSELG